MSSEFYCPTPNILGSTPDRSPDRTRTEEVWSEHKEELLLSWMSEWHSRRKGHELRQRVFTRLFYAQAIPTIAIPVVCSQIPTDACPNRTNAWLVTGFVVTSILSTLQTFLKLDVVAQRHLHAANGYADILSDAQEELAKGRRFRRSVDISLSLFKSKADHLLQSAPYTPLPKPLHACPGAVNVQRDRVVSV